MPDLSTRMRSHGFFSPNLLVAWMKHLLPSENRHLNQLGEIESKSGVLWFIGMATLFSIVSGCLTISELRFPHSLPLQSMDVPTVPLFNAWTIGWNADRLLHGFQGYWDAPIFHPARMTFAFSEPQPATMIVAPLVWATGSPVVGYKVWLFLSLALNGFFAALLLRRMKYHWWHQAVGGVAIALLPVVHQQIDVLQLVPVWGILWLWSSLAEFSRQPGLRRGIETGLAFGLSFAMCVHHGLFLSLLLPVAVVLVTPSWTTRSFLTGAVVALAVALVLTLPVVLPIHDAVSTNDFLRQELTVKNLSTEPHHYLASPAGSLLCTGDQELHESQRLCVGWFRILLALWGVTLGLLKGPRRAWVLFLLLTGTLAATLSLGMNLDLFGWKPWLMLSEYLPGLKQVRSVHRFSWFVQITLVLLAIEGLKFLQKCHENDLFGRWKKTSLAVLVIVPGLVCAAEVLPTAPRRGGVPDLAQHAGWTRYIRENISSGRAVACFPFAEAHSVRDYAQTTRWMLIGLQHGVPLINGYSGFFPRSSLKLQQELSDESVSVHNKLHLQSLGVEFLVVSRLFREPSEMLKSQTAANDGKLLKLVFSSSNNIDVYKLVDPQTPNSSGQ